MSELLQANWVLLVLALILGIAIAWWVFAANRKTRIERAPEEEEEGGKVARRNQALIDAPPAAGKLSSAANTQDVAAAPVGTDAEAGPAVEPKGAPHTEATAVPEPEAPPPPPPPAPEPSSAAEPAPKPASGGEADDLSQIKGLGPKLRAQLAGMGIIRFEQIAAWDDAEIDRVDAQLGRFQGRIRRDNWVEQAKLLAAGDRQGFEGRFGKS